jgi:hypothetical protein
MQVPQHPQHRQEDPKVAVIGGRPRLYDADAVRVMEAAELEVLEQRLESIREAGL